MPSAEVAQRPRWQLPIHLARQSVVFLALWAALVFLHWPLLNLPYLWDEGYFVTIAFDLMNTGDPVPVSVKSNGHPPFVAAYLAAAWKIFGFQPLITRLAMLAWAGFALVQVFLLGESLGGRRLGISCVVCIALYPVFFVQGSLAHLDLPAAALTLAGVRLYLASRPRSSAAFLTLAAMAKETSILVPLALLVLELVSGPSSRRRERLICLIAPAAALCCWFAYHWLRTGYVLGNPEFFHENVTATLHPLRFLVALVMRLWHLVGHMHLWALAVPALWLYWRGRERPHRQAGDFERLTGMLATGLVIAFSIIGGALLARYLLLVVPLLICFYLFVLQKHTRYWIAFAVTAGVLFAAALFAPPILPAAAEDSLRYREVIVSNQRAVDLVVTRYTGVEAIASWPIPDLLAKPHLGYTATPVEVAEIAELTSEELRSARLNADFRIAVLAAYNLDRSVIDRWPGADHLRTRIGRKQYLTLQQAAALLGGEIVHHEEHGTAGFVVVEMTTPPGRTPD